MLAFSGISAATWRRTSKPTKINLSLETVRWLFHPCWLMPDGNGTPC